MNLELGTKKQESGDRRKSKKVKGKRKKWYENALMLSPINLELGTKKQEPGDWMTK